MFYTYLRKLFKILILGFCKAKRTHSPMASIKGRTGWWMFLGIMHICLQEKNPSPLVLEPVESLVPELTLRGQLGF